VKQILENNSSITYLNFNTIPDTKSINMLSKMLNLKNSHIKIIKIDKIFNHIGTILSLENGKKFLQEIFKKNSINELRFSGKKLLI
jgi:hypothetical protein